MNNSTYQKFIRHLNESVEKISDHDEYNSLLAKIGDAQVVLIGESSHGTHEFYQARAQITKQLIIQKNFTAIAIEADWPDAHRVNCYLQGAGDKNDCESALSEFTRFPTWMWRNVTLPPFLKWLRSYNDYLTFEDKIGFYGMDLYSLYSSMHAVIDYLSKVDPKAAERARNRYACFDHAKQDPQSYGYQVSHGIKQACLQEVITQYQEMQNQVLAISHKDHFQNTDEFFYATQNARLVKNAEAYYRSLFDGHVASWNVRDKHMAETLAILIDYLAQKRKHLPKIVVWAHNSHIGDARATEMSEKGEVNLGQLVREQHEKTFLLGFSTYQGTVTAASDWDAPAECKSVVPGLPSSFEEVFHHVSDDNFLLDLRCNKHLNTYLNIPRLQRAIGVIYRPETERDSHYFFTHLPQQFDCIIHFDQTNAVKPLDINMEWQTSHQPVD